MSTSLSQKFGSDLIAAFSDALLKQLIAELDADGFEAYLTSVGGSGLGILSPYPASAHSLKAVAPASGPATPPETPDELSDSDDVEPLRSDFGTKPIDEFAHWAEDRGRWLFV